LSQLLSKVTAASCSFYIKCSTCPQRVRLADGRRTLKMCCYRSRLVFSCCFWDTIISKGGVATHLRCYRIFSYSIITNVLVIMTVK